MMTGSNVTVINTSLPVILFPPEPISWPTLQFCNLDALEESIIKLYFALLPHQEEVQTVVM